MILDDTDQRRIKILKFRNEIASEKSTEFCPHKFIEETRCTILFLLLKAEMVPSTGFENICQDIGNKYFILINIEQTHAFLCLTGIVSQTKEIIIRRMS